MKKTLLSLAVAACAINMSAADLTFYYGDEAEANGAVVEHYEYEVYPYTGGKVEVFIEPKIYISKTKATDITLTSKSNYPVQLCIGGQCEAAESIVKTPLSFVANQKENLLLDCSVYLDEGAEIALPAIEVLLEAYYVDAPNEVTTLTVKMGSSAGINDAVTYNGINVVGKSLNYNVERPTEIVVYNLSGQAVMTKRVNGNGSISLESMKTGIYLYRSTGNGTSAGKIIIR